MIATASSSRPPCTAVHLHANGASSNGPSSAMRHRNSNSFQEEPFAQNSNSPGPSMCQMTEKSEDDIDEDNTDTEYFVPLESPSTNVSTSKGPRPLRRRGAAVHSQLLKSAFEASMSSYNTDDDSDNCDDDYSMYASNSTLASRDDICIVNVPRKRIRGGENKGGTPTAMAAEAPRSGNSEDGDIGRMFGNMLLRRESSGYGAASVTSNESSPHRGGRKIDNQTISGNVSCTNALPFQGKITGETPSHVLTHPQGEHRGSVTSISTSESLDLLWQTESLGDASGTDS
eukprot:Nitzschia sp. Nitz4//scaffold197_size40390//14471//15331//NITZ4_007515-RA/size40390-processed-gene-0.2-mRNA-1//1//CDS//3329540478//2941//frame0